MSKMGNESLPSPAQRRTLNGPLSPSPFRKTLSGPDIGWRSLAHRHKFLLTTLSLLTFLCTIYLYFAVTLGAKDSCSGLGGTQRAVCQLAAKAVNANAHKAHHRRLMFVEESVLKTDPSKDTREKRNKEELITYISKLGNRKNLEKKADHATKPSVSMNGELWNGDIVKYKAMLDSMVKPKQGPKKKAEGRSSQSSQTEERLRVTDHKPSTGSRLRGSSL